MITIINYGAGNVGSVRKALEALGQECEVTADPLAIARAQRIVFPGVGAFGDTMEKLRERGLIEPIKAAIARGVPFLGICVGMQALFEESEENPGIKGLCVLKGKVVRFTQGKVPQIGWNRLEQADAEIFGEGGFVYFVNSYYCAPEEPITVATTEYGVRFASAVRSNNVCAVQFHPEKSGTYGLEILRRWLAC
jgi:glutamine amidotransferase